MPPQSARIRAGVMALFALIWLFDFSPLCIIKCNRKLFFCMNRWKLALTAAVWSFSIVCFQVLPQVACFKGCIITLAGSIKLFSTVRFQMRPKIWCPSRGICLICLHCVFSNGSSNYLDKRRHNRRRIGCIGLAFPYRAFYVRPQVSCLIWCILARVAFVCLFPTVRFWMPPQGTWIR